MRFHQLKIPAYGPFSDFSMELPKGDSDLHLIYGPNEAGKSSLLRAIHQMLYGIRTALQDKMLAAGDPLRIYIPYGVAWYPYLTRRMAERPSNLAFFMRAVLSRG